VNKTQYEGDVLKDSAEMVMHGRGKLTWPDGSVYDGWFKNGHQHGAGRLIHANGDYYEGEWKKD